jgi:integrase
MSQRGRPGTGQIRRQPRTDGLTTFSLRVRANGQRRTFRLGTELDGWTEARAEIELANVCAQIRARTWSPPSRPSDEPQLPSFHEWASMWLRRRIAEGIAENTRKDYLWQLSSHLLPILGSYRIDEITNDVVEAFKEHKLDERATIVAAVEAGEQLRTRIGRVRRPLSHASINKFLVLLTRILESAVRRGWLANNPAAKVERLRVRRRKGAILEADELESLIAAARPRERCHPKTPERRRLVRELRDHHKLSWREIGARLEIASSTAVYLYRAAPARLIEDGRRALVAALGCGGLRATEAAELNVVDIDILHGKLHVRDSKTDAGVREIDMTPRLVDELAAYLATRTDARPDDPAFPTRSGARRDKDNIRNRVVAPALKQANREREAAGLPAIGVAVTPHTLRRTYISLLLSAGAEVPYVQAQVGHSDPKVTLEIYALVLKRRDRRRFGNAFDALMRDAIPSMQQAKMQHRGQQLLVIDGSRQEKIAA